MTSLFLTTLREVPAEAEVAGHKLLLRGGYIRKLAAGIYTLLPLGLKVVSRVETIIREEMNRVGAQELRMPALQPAELWQETGRWDVYGKELMRLSDRHERTFCLGPTHEEVITDLVRNMVRSYRQLPLNLYQIQTKYRDEIRPRFGLMRGREFLMKDAYSFDADDAGLEKSYQRMAGVYQRIFERCGLDYRVVSADPGAIGGSASQEYMVLAQTGEAEMVVCDQCDFATSQELAEGIKTGDRCGACASGTLKILRGIEVGHIFKLGTKYSEAMKATYLDEAGQTLPLVMGCYGIGVGRTAQAAIEQCHDEQGICWPMPLAPFHVVVVPANTSDPVQASFAESLYTDLQQAGVEVLLDDRDERAGVKFKDADLIGCPLRVVIGKKFAEGLVELKQRTRQEVALIPKEAVAARVVEMVREQGGV